MPFDQTPLDQHEAQGQNETKAEPPTKLGLLYAIFGLGAVLWIAAIVAFGLPGLYIPALIAVPFCFISLLLITVGK